MDPSLPFSSILRPNADGEGPAYLLLSSRHRSGWLLPVEPALRRAGLRSFGLRGMKGFVGSAMLAATLLRGKRLWLDVAPLGRRLATTLGETEVHLAFCIGTAGAYRKLTVQVMTRGQHVAAYAKIAADGLAQSSLEREHDNLLRLSAIARLRDHVPAVLGWFDWQDAKVLVVTAGSGAVGPSRLTDEHGEFLRQLRDAFVDEQPFECSPMWGGLVATVRRLSARMPREGRVRYDMALRRLAAGLGRVVLPFSVAHRDFAPWNTRIGPYGLFVFDWETASDGITPLYDTFHFQAIQAAQAGRPFHPSTGRPPQLADGFWREWNAHLSLLYLAYLVDMGLFYTEARLQAPAVGDERLCRWFGQHIDACVGCHHAVA
jgi:hypothetical protein